MFHKVYDWKKNDRDEDEILDERPNSPLESFKINWTCFYNRNYLFCEIFNQKYFDVQVDNRGIIPENVL